MRNCLNCQIYGLCGKWKDYRLLDEQEANCFEFDEDTIDEWNNEDFITCPECGYIFNDDETQYDDFYKQGRIEILCPMCNKDFILEIETRPIYYVKKKRRLN